jgi:hypothetical protein
MAKESVPLALKKRAIELCDKQRTATLPDGTTVSVKMTCAQAIAKACEEFGVEVRPGWKGNTAGSFIFSWRNGLETAVKREAIKTALQSELAAAPAPVAKADDTPKLDLGTAAAFAAKLEAAKKDKGDEDKGKKKGSKVELDQLSAQA